MENRIREQPMPTFPPLPVDYDSLDIVVISITAVALIYSVVLAIFRHNVWEDYGIFDSLSEILRFFLLLICTFRYQSFKILEKKVYSKLL